MKGDEEKQDHACDSLNQVKPVSGVRVGQVVRPRFHRDHKTVDGVIDERYKDSTDLDEDNVRNRLQVLHGVIEIAGAAQCFRVCVEVFQHEESEGNDAGKLMKFAQDKRPAQSNRQKRAPLQLNLCPEGVGPKLRRL